MIPTLILAVISAFQPPGETLRCNAWMTSQDIDHGKVVATARISLICTELPPLEGCSTTSRIFTLPDPLPGQVLSFCIEASDGCRGPDDFVVPIGGSASRPPFMPRDPL